ncbi:helicase-like transcription factor CHR28 [Impatiens glandulifera]|uniref:helicase-like transcription factor CHR28 n=1 Tax=Impatiens glandulifera TaxID=253017 RepID=UPI001FB19069|nr:helicase-like transcription factor CHR28 [Impatiens glandulifera]
MVQRDDSAPYTLNNGCSQNQTDLPDLSDLFWVEPTQSVPFSPLRNSEAFHAQKQVSKGYSSTVTPLTSNGSEGSHNEFSNGYAIRSFARENNDYASASRVNMQHNHLKDDTIYHGRHLEGEGGSQYKSQNTYEMEISAEVKDSVPTENFAPLDEYDSFKLHAGETWPIINDVMEGFLMDNQFSNDAILPKISREEVSKGVFQVPMASSADANITDAQLKYEEFRHSVPTFNDRFLNAPFQTFPSTFPNMSNEAQARCMKVERKDEMDGHHFYVSESVSGFGNKYISSPMFPSDFSCNSSEKQDTKLFSKSASHSVDINLSHTIPSLSTDGCSLDAMTLEKSSMLPSILRMKHTRHIKDVNGSTNSSHFEKLNSSSHFVNDSDLCIIEDEEVSCSATSSANKKSIIVPPNSTSIEPLNHSGIASARVKPNDERLVFRAALQDLFQPKSEANPPADLLAVPLLRHQRIALSWMVQKETASPHCSGGILADDQGLGKTVSTIALILKERAPPSSFQTNDLKHGQVETLNLDDDDSVAEVHGPKQDIQSSQVRPNGNDSSRRNTCTSKRIIGRPTVGTLIVCPTSVLRQWAEELNTKVTSKAKLSVLVYHGSNRTKDPLELAKYDVVLTTYSIVSMEVPKQPIADEDNDDSGKRDSYSSGMKRKYPLKHKKEIKTALMESEARPLARVGWFRVVLDEAQSIKNHKTQVARACWGLRAKRRWCLSGTPIQNSIDDLYSYFRFLRYDPYAGYKSFCSAIKVPITKNPKKGYKKLQAVLKTVMLRRTKGTLLDGEPIINLPPKSVQLTKVDFTKEERGFYHILEAESRAQFAEYAAAGTVKKNYINILLMLLRLRQACNHPLLVKDNFKASSLWKSYIEMAKKLPHEKQISLLDSFEASAICGLCNDAPEDAVVTTCGHVFCNQCISGHLMDDITQCPNTNCKGKVSSSSIFPRAALESCISENSHQDTTLDIINCSKNSEELGPSSWCGLSGSSKIRAALEVLESLSKPSNDITETGLLETIDQESGLKGDSRKPGEKAIVFSQWTRMLDLLETSLKNSSIKYRRLDGTMSVQSRDRAVKDFNTLPEVTVIIMSLKAASLGLNMVAACHVLLLDLWWNPTTEDQAIDRAHRIGQTRPVKVLRLTVKDTVEDRILALQQRKRKMVASAFGEDEKGSRQTRLTEEDLKYLFMA